MKREFGKYLLRLVFLGLVVYIALLTLAYLILGTSISQSSLHNLGQVTFIVGATSAFGFILIRTSGASWVKRLFEYLPSEMKEQRVRDSAVDWLHSIIIASLLAAFSGWTLMQVSTEFGFTPPIGSIPQIGSLKSEVSNYYELIQDPKFNYYLKEATLFLDDDIEWRASAIFCSESPSGRFIKTRFDGEYEISVDHCNVKANGQLQINEDEWKIDSQDAIEIFFQYDEIRQCITTMSRKVSGSFWGSNRLSIQHIEYIPENPLVWTLSLGGCATSEGNFFLNATTGKIIDSDDVDYWLEQRLMRESSYESTPTIPANI